ncbi:MAG: AAA-associated domain-containing protein, partial [Bdellovibrionota bacterium]
LPNAGISEILGLVELLKNKGGREDIYKLAAELKMEFGDTLAVIRGAELLGLVHTPGGDVVIEPLGEKITKSKINGRKQIIRERLKKVPVFERASDFLKNREGLQAGRDELMEKLAEWVPNENAEQTFTTLVYWGRYAELFGYNDDTSSFYLDSESNNSGGT